MISSAANNVPAVHVIAEAGTNHNGNVETGRHLINAAVSAAADSVKFQMIWPAGLYLPRVYRDGGYTNLEVFEQRAATALAPGDFKDLAACAAEHGITFSASVFDTDGIALLDALDAPYIKIASCDLNNSPLIQAAARTGRRLIISTGMSSLAEIDRAVTAVRATGHDDFVLLHCVSVYPAPVERMNLGFIDALRNRFECPVGLSDHTRSSIAAQMAVAKGATVIEKHFTLDRRQQGFDHAYAHEPAELKSFIADIRCAEAACTRPAEKVSNDEKTVRQRARRGLYASRDIAPGERITADDVLSVRPEGPLEPGDLPLVIDAVARCRINQHEAFDWGQLEVRQPAMAGSEMS